MELNKCKRCGAFFATNDSICPNCKPKDNFELSKLKDFLSENDLPSSMDALSYSTGISIKNLNRFLGEDNLSSINNEGNIQKNNINIEL